ncbi:dodecenoyl-CoA isomerase Ecym_3109 [Eremothecium cymbalariae DBVPG|uniref:Uncharacterized protein n=1 Tax=Eremothecium cymbalariae (strain CBS 270.75 / DBVPG 7215 / KCTC 17166 / NRRL Y-17582) TaxID=931890 RepID=G8JR48_ERECY|nr:Hypothetical protein Ecym_3109 [Eremothecium cymbalariae DBVPG\
MSGSPNLTYRIEGFSFIITLTNPKNLNSMALDDYLALALLVRQAEKHPDTRFTVLQSTGRYFSSGGNITAFARASYARDTSTSIEGTVVGNMLSRVEFLTSCFINHSKVLIACLNGPVVGLSAAMVLLCDIVYSMNDQIYMQFPFSTLGLSSEGALSVSLVKKLGSGVANEALLLGTPVKYEYLKGNVISRDYKMNDVESFNKKVLDDLGSYGQQCHESSLKLIKSLLTKPVQAEYSRAIGDEMYNAVDLFVKGYPQERFKALSAKLRNSKI